MSIGGVRDLQCPGRWGEPVWEGSATSEWLLCELSGRRSQRSRLKTALRLYYDGTLARLIQAKKTWDPNNHFHYSQSLPLTYRW